MKISCGVLFIKDKKVLVAHAYCQNKWDIPKGKPEFYEKTYTETAIRECREETGFEIEDAEDLIPLGIKPYTDYKKLALFLYNGEKYPNVNQCKCSTTDKDPKTGQQVTEMDDYKYISYDEIDSHCSPNLAKVLKDILEQFYGAKAA